jgi:hypothetical protein
MSKPAGWIDEYEFYTNEQYEDFEEELRDGLIPLYKHPSKQLTDQEIYDLAEETAHGFDGSVHVLRFARELLRKARA